MSRQREGAGWLPCLTAFAGALVALAAAAPPAAAQSCGALPPATPVPSFVWGDLAPTDPVGTLLPRNRRSDYTGQQIPSGCGSRTHWAWTGLDAANGYLFVSYAYGFQIWDIQGGNAAEPSRVVQKDALEGCNNGTFPFWPPPTEDKIRMLDVAVPAGKDTVAVTSGRFGTGVFVWDTTNKTAPFVRYQDKEKEALTVHVASTGGRDWAFVGTFGAGVRLYDLTEAKNRNYNRCVEDAPEGSPSSSSACPGVYKGTLGNFDRVFSLDGTTVPGLGHVLVVPDVQSPRGLELWDVTTPASPTLIHREPGGSAVEAAAIWHQGGSTYVVRRGTDEAAIWDVSDCLSQYKSGQTCSFPTSPAWSSPMPRTDGSNSVTFSRAGNVPFLFFGTSRSTPPPLGGDRAQLFDVTNPAQPVEISLNGSHNGQCGEYNYWTWYDQFERVSPRVGKFMGDYFYRLGGSILDVHELTGLSSGPPQADFTFSPTSEIYPDVPGTPGTPGTVVTLQDTSIGDVGFREWLLPDSATIHSGTLTSVELQIRFVEGSGGASHDVTLIVLDSNRLNDDPETKSIPVLDPAPTVGSVSSNVPSAQVCTPVTFTAENVKGFPVPGLSWEVLPQGGGSAVATGGDVNPFEWDTAGVEAGSYLGVVTATNSTGEAEKASSPVEIQELEPLGFTGDETPTATTPSGGTVTVSIVGKTTGATEWSWDFGDGQGWRPWSSDPVQGPEPTHTYDEDDVAAICGGTLPCTFKVRVRIRNCVETEPLESAVLEVTISELTPLKAEFALVTACPFGCPVGQELEFVDESTGDPEQWVYKWNNTSSSPSSFGACTGSQEIRSTPKTKHTYTTAGTFYPCLEVRKGNDSDFFVHETAIVIESSSPPPSPSISVSGPSTREVGQQGTYSASASNCTPSSIGWSWSVSGGGTIHSGQGSSSISASWATTGSKTVSVTNSACGSEPGSRSVTVSSGGSGGSGGSLTAKFQASGICFVGSCATEAGSEVTFVDESTGSPERFKYDWMNTGSSPSTCTFTGSGSTAPQTKFTWHETGTFRPCLRVEKGSAADVFVHDPIVVGEGAGASGSCVPSETTLCLHGRRFAIEVEWEGFNGVDAGLGQATLGTNETGYFWFFNEENIELAVKILDATGLNGHFWVFYGSLSNVEFDLTVTDTVTEVSKTYHNPLHEFASVGDDKALPGEGEGSQPPSGLLASFSFGVACPFGCNFTVGEELDIIDDSAGDPEEWAYRMMNTNDQATGFSECTGEEELLSTPKTTHIYESAGEFHPCLEVRKGEDSDLFLHPPVTVTDAGGSATRRATFVPPTQERQPFQTGDLLERVLAGGAWTMVAWDAEGIALEPTSKVVTKAETCDPEIHLCLRDGRFRVEVEWADFEGGEGFGHPVPMTFETGHFWFFGPENVEVLVKVLDGNNGYYWVFFGALTNLELWLTVTDVETGRSKSYYNPPHNFASRGDDRAIEKGD